MSSVDLNQEMERIGIDTDDIRKPAYKNLLGLADVYYNQGLDYARNGTISLAIDSLRRAVALNKNHVQALNLLGLCYYRIGEFTLAFREWIFSLNARPRGNRAQMYLSEIEKNESMMAQITACVRCYNRAVEYVKDDNEELAIMQLKKAVERIPDMVNAQLLLALLRIKAKDYFNAQTGLRKVLAIDSENELALKYMGELEKIRARRRESRANISTESIVKNDDVIVPSTPFKEYSLGRTIIDIVIGIVLGICVMQFLVFPAVRDKQSNPSKSVVLEQSQQLDDLQQKLKEAQEKASTFEKSNNEAQERLKKLEGGANDAANRLAKSGIIKFQSSDFQGGYEDLKAAASLEDLTADAYTILVRACVAVGKLDEAKQYVEEMKKKVGEDAAAVAQQYVTAAEQPVQPVQPAQPAYNPNAGAVDPNTGLPYQAQPAQPNGGYADPNAANVVPGTVDPNTGVVGQ